MQSRTSLVHGTSADEAYGLIHGGCLGSVLSVCVSRTTQHVSMTAFRQSGWSLNSIKKAERSLTEADWTRLKNLMEQADFWAMPETHHRMGLDGFNWTIEGRDRDRYHSSECWAPDDGAFYDLGNLLVEFSGLEMPHDSP
jgi:hypothetical protein